LNLDLAFVLDTTGSMGDELSYLTVELGSIAAMVQASTEGLSMRYGLVVYRDEGDEYVTRSYDFTSDLDAFRGLVAEQSANGGGDTEESVHEAVKAMNELSWREDNTARVAFLVADAPPHDQEQAQLIAGVDQARRKGIKLFPVAASGSDPRFEYLMRSAAQWTLARYLFITDDSGIGDEHEEPMIPCYEVQYLNILITRLIQSELQGRVIPPEPGDVVRAFGGPVDGLCSFQDGSEARLY
jgi:von Willebrand factor type A domain